MAQKRFTAEQIINKLRQAEVELANGKSIKEVCRGIGVSGLTTPAGLTVEESGEVVCDALNGSGN